MQIGVHVSIAKGYAAAAKEIIGMGGNTFQFFSRNPRGSQIKKYDEKDIQAFQALRETYHFGPICAHAPYTMNLAAKDARVYDFSKKVIREDIHRMAQLGIAFFCMHPGSHVGTGCKEGIDRIVSALNEAITGKDTICVLLETMSGRGTEIGSTFEELKSIVDGINQKEHIGICFDLCHTFSSGYDIVDDLSAVLNKFDSILNLARLKVIHLNDSLLPFGSKKDRHKPLGEGTIGLEAIGRLLSAPELKDKTFLLETPLDFEGHKREIEMVKNLYLTK